MPGLNKGAAELSQDNMSDHTNKTLVDIAYHATSPVVICGVNRRLNVGNYEHVDIYAGVSIPLVGVLPEDVDTLKKAVEDGIALGMQMASEETGKRYHELKGLQGGGRPTK